MDYQRVYTQFIADRRANPPADGEYTEKHHILPRSLGGDDEPDNLIRLTAGDHFFAHVLLAKIYGGAMWYAISLMSKASKFTMGREPRKLYEYQKKHIARVNSQEFKRRHKDPEYAAHHRQLSFDRWQDPEYRAKQTARMKKAWQDPEYIEKMANRKKPNGDKISEHNKRLWATEEYRNKMSKRKISSTVFKKGRESTNKKPVRCIDNGMNFDSAKSAQDWVNLETGYKSLHCVAQVCRGEKTSFGGYRFAYAG